jgi:hypothetical protein
LTPTLNPISTSTLSSTPLGLAKDSETWKFNESVCHGMALSTAEMVSSGSWGGREEDRALSFFRARETRCLKMNQETWMSRVCAKGGEGVTVTYANNCKCLAICWHCKCWLFECRTTTQEGPSKLGHLLDARLLGFR